MAINISYGGVALQNSTTLIDGIAHDQAPSRNLNQLSLARAHGSKLTAAYFGNKVVRITGRILGSSPINCDSLVDAFRLAITGIEANLDIDFNGSTRRYVATVGQTTITRPTSANFAQFDVEFNCSQPFGFDTASGSLLGATVLTTTGVNTAVTLGGTAPDQVPIITLLVNSGTGLATKAVTITNALTGVGITVTRTWAAADSLEIDCAALTVKVNGAIVNYTGAFPSWAVGAGNIRYADGFTTRNVSLSAVYTKRWL
jgi:hypothetical protein